MNYNLQRLRASAAIAVLLFHCVPFFERAGGSLGFLKPLIACGYAGVDLFFVLSGFIIAKGVSARHYDWTAASRFLEKRAYRIFLGYWPVLGLTVVFYMATMPERVTQVSAMTNLLLLSNRIPELVIGQAWSLSYELFFYVSFGLLALAGRRFLRSLVMGYVAVILIANLVNPELAELFVLSPFLLELFAGAVLGSVSTQHWPRIEVWVLAVAAILLLALWIAIEMRTPLMRAFVVGGAAFSLVASAELLRLRGVNGVSTLSRLGDSSYSLYLIHYQLLEAFSIFVMPVAGLKPYLPAIFCVWVGMIIGVSHLFHRVVERPLYDFVCEFRRLGSASQTATAL
ncbi:MAG: acyltransferase [Candidatus Methylophosphatis roskildensis]